MRSYVYFISDGKHIKIGKTRALMQRLKDLQTSNSSRLFYVAVIEFSNEKAAYRKEKQLHECFKPYVVNGEWFNISKELVMQLKGTRELYKGEIFEEENVGSLGRKKLVSDTPPEWQFTKTKGL